MRRRMMAMAVLAWAAPAMAADLVAVVPGSAAPAAVAVRPIPLEGVREVHPQVGRNVAITVNGAAVPTIEWRNPVELRVRTFSGAPLTEGQRASVVALAPECIRGEARELSARTEVNQTFVVRYDCVWLQGFEPGRLALLGQ